MMYFKEKQNLQEDKVYGQECKGVNYVSTKRSSSPPPPTKEEKEAEMEREAEREVQTAERKMQDKMCLNKI